jgi:hypothetical protein
MKNARVARLGHVGLHIHDLTAQSGKTLRSSRPR